MNLRQRFFRLTFLNVVSNLTVPLAGLVDTAMLGHLPDIRFLAGVALAGVIFDFLYFTFAFLRMGTTGPAAQAVGRGDDREMHQVLQRSLLLALACALVLLLLRGLLANFAFSLLAGEQAVEAAGRGYYDIRIWGAPAVLANLVFLGWFLGREESRLALALTATANGANIALNYVFILRLGLAAQGAALATVISQYLALALALGLYWRRRHGADWHWRTVLDLSRIPALLRLHGDILVRSLAIVTTFSLFTSLSALFGTLLLTATTLLLKILTLASYLIDGAAYSTEILAGRIHGGQNRSGLRQLLHLALTVGLGAAAGFVAIVVFTPRLLLNLLTSHQEIVELAVTFRFWLATNLAFGAVAYIFDGFLLGLTDVRVLRNAMLISLLGFYLPLTFVALRFDSPQLLWLAFTSFTLARVAFLARRVFHHAAADPTAVGVDGRR